MALDARLARLRIRLEAGDLRAGGYRPLRGGPKSSRRPPATPCMLMRITGGVCHRAGLRGTHRRVRRTRRRGRSSQRRDRRSGAADRLRSGPRRTRAGCWGIRPSRWRSSTKAIALGAEDPTSAEGSALSVPVRVVPDAAGRGPHEHGLPEEAAPMFERALESSRRSGRHRDRNLDADELRRTRPRLREGGAGARPRNPGLSARRADGQHVLARLDPLLPRICTAYGRRVPEGATQIERSIEVGREARTALEFESQRVAALSAARLGAGDPAGALEAAEESVRLAHDRSNEAMLAVLLPRPGRGSAGE